MECEGCSMFVFARVRDDWYAESAGAYLCGICLTRRMAKVEAGKNKSGN